LDTATTRGRFGLGLGSRSVTEARALRGEVDRDEVDPVAAQGVVCGNVSRETVGGSGRLEVDVSRETFMGTRPA